MKKSAEGVIDSANENKEAMRKYKAGEVVADVDMFGPLFLLLIVVDVLLTNEVKGNLGAYLGLDGWHHAITVYFQEESASY